MNVSSINTVSDAKRLFAAELQAEKSGDASSSSAMSAEKAKQSQTRVAARQFEAIILRQMLSPTIEPLMSGKLIGGQAMSGGSGVYGYLVTDVLANSLSQGGGLGFSKMIEKQLTPKSTVTAAHAAAVYGAGKVDTHE
jgi:flagellar protein FlgJ